MPSFAEMQKRIAARKLAESRAALEHKRAEIASKHRMCTAFACWRQCKRLDCRRHHRCCGDSLACFERYWNRYPDAYHKWIVAAGDARAIGHSMEEAMRVADSQARGGSGCAEFAWVRPYLESFDRKSAPSGRAGGRN
jgi:hypothetical protein